METDHRVVIGDSRDLTELGDDSVELVLTSPPYPMIEMWDDLFARLNPEIETRLAAGEGQAAFDLMHAELRAVWEQLSRVLVEGGIACVNVGDATRKLDGSFRVYQNHSRIVDDLQSLGFEPLPEVLWRKPVNSAAKFMGSGMLPPNAYVTLEHEYLLIFRNGTDQRSFEPGADRRYASAFFWEERNRWFSDVWTEIRGELQELEPTDARERSAAFPFEIPYRLINMYSLYEDTVLDPFWGTGTTSLAAMVAGRHSVGCEFDPEFVEVFHDRVGGLEDFSRRVVRKRLADHVRYVEEREDADEALAYEADHYGFPVTTRQERAIRFYRVEALERTDQGYRVGHTPVEDTSVDVGGVTAKTLADFEDG